MCADRDRKAGFSVVEVLATLAIAGAILAALASAVSQSVRQTDRVAMRAERRETTGRSLAALARAIEGAARVRWAGKDAGFVFAGTPDALVFASNRREGTALRTWIVRVETVAESGGLALAWSEAPFAPELKDITEAAFGRLRLLPTGGARLRFAYASAGTVQVPEFLVDDWPAADALPVAIRVALTDPGSGELRASLRVPMRATAEPGCLAPRKALCSRFDERKAPDDKNATAGTGSGPVPR